MPLVKAIFSSIEPKTLGDFALISVALVAYFYLLVEFIL